MHNGAFGWELNGGSNDVGCNKNDFENDLLGFE